MGTSTNAMLVYGYHLGSTEDGLEVHEAKESETNPYGYLKLPWYDDEHEEITDEEGEELSTIELFAKRLYESIPDAPPLKFGWEYTDAIQDHLGVWFEDHCSGSYPMYILATASHTARRGDAKPLDLAALAQQAATEGWDDKLAQALAVLQITPDQERPAWLLCSYWSS